MDCKKSSVSNSSNIILFYLSYNNILACSDNRDQSIAEYAELTIIKEDTFCVSPVLSRCHLQYISLDKTSSMKLFSLLMVAIVLIGITTQAFACNYERMSRIPNYAKITSPKKSFSIPNAHGICVAPNGNFAVMSYNNAKKIRIYYSCGKLMKEVDLSKHGFQAATDCAFTDHSLYVADHNRKKCTNCRQLGNLFEFFLLVDTFFKLQHVKTGFTSPQIVVGKMSMCTIPTVN